MYLHRQKVDFKLITISHFINTLLVRIDVAGEVRPVEMPTELFWLATLGPATQTLMKKYIRIHKIC